MCSDIWKIYCCEKGEWALFGINSTLCNKRRKWAISSVGAWSFVWTLGAWTLASLGRQTHAHQRIMFLALVSKCTPKNYFSTLRAGRSISHTLGKKRVLKIELSPRRIKKFCTIHMRRFTSSAPARGARAPNRAISNSCLCY